MLKEPLRRTHECAFDEGHKVYFGAAGGDLDAAAYPFRFDGYKEIARPVAQVFVVVDDCLQVRIPMAGGA